MNSNISAADECDFRFQAGRFLGFPSALDNSPDSSPLESSALTWPLSSEITGLMFGSDPIHA